MSVIEKKISRFKWIRRLMCSNRIVCLYSIHAPITLLGLLHWLSTGPRPAVKFLRKQKQAECDVLAVLRYWVASFSCLWPSCPIWKGSVIQEGASLISHNVPLNFTGHSQWNFWLVEFGQQVLISCLPPLFSAGFWRLSSQGCVTIFLHSDHRYGPWPNRKSKEK